MANTYTEGLTVLVTKRPRAASAKPSIAELSELSVNAADKMDALSWESVPPTHRESQFGTSPIRMPIHANKVFVVWSGITDDTVLPLPDLQDVVLEHEGSFLFAARSEANWPDNLTIDKEAEVAWVSLHQVNQSDDIFDKLGLSAKGWSLAEGATLPPGYPHQPEFQTWFVEGKAPHPILKGGTFSLGRLEAKFDQIAKLEANWDSYGAPPIDDVSIAEARRLVIYGVEYGFPKPFIAPGSDAGVGIEWKTPYGDLYVDIIPGEKTTYALTVYASDEELDGYLEDIDFPQLLGRIRGT